MLFLIILYWSKFDIFYVPTNSRKIRCLPCSLSGYFFFSNCGLISSSRLLRLLFFFVLLVILEEKRNFLLLKIYFIECTIFQTNLILVSIFGLLLHPVFQFEALYSIMVPEGFVCSICRILPNLKFNVAFGFFFYNIFC